MFGTPRNPTEPHGQLDAAARTAQKLDQIITAQKIPRGELAAQIGVHPATLRRWLSGESALTLDAIQALSRHLHISPADIWTDPPSEPPSEEATAA